MWSCAKKKFHPPIHLAYIKQDISPQITQIYADAPKFICVNLRNLRIAQIFDLFCPAIQPAVY